MEFRPTCCWKFKFLVVFGVAMKLKRKVKSTQACSVSASENARSSNDVERQLEHQRRKKKVSELSGNRSETTTASPLPRKLGNFIFDKEKKAYYPNQKLSKNNSRKSPGNDKDSSLTSGENFVLEKTTSIAHLSEVCSNTRRYRALRTSWIGKVIAQTMTFDSSCKNSAIGSEESNWISIFPPSKTQVTLTERQGNNDRELSIIPSKNIPPDLNCKLVFPPHFRSFDIQQSTDESLMPSIASIIKGGVFISTPHSPRVWKKTDIESDDWHSSVASRNNPYATVVRIAPRDSCHLVNFVSLSYKKPSCMEMWKIAADSTTFTSINIGGHGCNDVAFHPNFGSENFTIAQAPRYRRNADKCVLYCNILSEKTTSSKIRDQSRSDALCVEYLNPNIILLGHRNGAISFHDTRTAVTQAVVGSSLAESEGSVTSILPLKNENAFLCKLSFGSCSVWDLRMVSDRVDDSSFPLLKMTVPKHLCPSQSLSSCCTGVAIDPSESIAIAPFADDNRRLANIALWSLTTGQFLGSRLCESAILSDGNSSGQVEKILPYFELCPKVTSSWELKSSVACESHCSNEDYSLSRRKNSWSLWFKSYGINSDSPPEMGSIHQLMFPWKA